MYDGRSSTIIRPDHLPQCALRSLSVNHLLQQTQRGNQLRASFETPHIVPNLYMEKISVTDLWKLGNAAANRNVANIPIRLGAAASFVTVLRLGGTPAHPISTCDFCEYMRFLRDIVGGVVEVVVVAEGVAALSTSFPSECVSN